MLNSVFPTNTLPYKCVQRLAKCVPSAGRPYPHKKSKPRPLHFESPFFETRGGLRVPAAQAASVAGHARAHERSAHVVCCHTRSCAHRSLSKKSRGSRPSSTPDCCPGGERAP